jgi:flotillin
MKNAEGVKALGDAEAAAEAAMLLAPVTAQLTLAREIGENEGYQKYLISVRQIESEQEIGVATAGALKEADIKIIANGGDVKSGVSSVGDILSPKGGTAIAGMLSALAQTDEGKAIIGKISS